MVDCIVSSKYLLAFTPFVVASFIIIFTCLLNSLRHYFHRKPNKPFSMILPISVLTSVAANTGSIAYRKVTLKEIRIVNLLSRKIEPHHTNWLILHIHSWVSEQ